MTESRISNTPLNETEVRVLASLIEKEQTTPEYYPLTLNALTNACNQKNNRDPIMSLGEVAIARAVESLRGKKLVFQVTGAGNRVPKYRQHLVDSLGLSPPEVALACVLMLRGPQTVGELRSRCSPIYQFPSLEEVQVTLDALTSNEERPALARRLPRQPGRKEVRYAHLLAGEPTPEQLEDTTRDEPAVLQVRADNERLAIVEAELAALKSSFDELSRQFREFKKQFE